ncbi:MAG: YdiU family protein, partial [Campylobacterales bacterium]|nr:YdiU family protein [Campylobacterales bacterium]
KLHLKSFNPKLFNELITLMIETSVDYTLFFRELSNIPDDITKLIQSFYNDSIDEKLLQRWSMWLESWKLELHITTPQQKEEISSLMKQVNPKYILRESILVSAYKQAQEGDYTLVNELQEVMTNPYCEQSKLIEEKYYRKKPLQYFDIAGISHVSCSS